ncbi:putative quinate O-hydroxycinnamoyltransferase [Medicago truncatula]|uniref:Anthranilate N-benzoyltransferase n=1 Tax=Medicago truncatula TaxID=3880 RepID=A0A072U7Q9_MEDTR|nr:anthranilate N-benzoyltransferase [Medicago truncatula]RHN50971.1 putative quinate O-hydroxycinnamoyltransferase [Medicago truncatula]
MGSPIPPLWSQSKRPSLSPPPKNFRNIKPNNSPTQILSFLHPCIFSTLCGRLKITKHEDDDEDTISCYLKCNNAGVLFVHAAATDITVANILQPIYLPPILHSFFPLNGVRNYEGTSEPLLAVQVTELVDGIFIGFTINHVAVDGVSTWHFINSWAEICKSKGCLQI